MNHHRPTDIPDPHRWRWIVVNSSGGKDSQTSLHQVALQARRLGIPAERIVVSHQTLGSMEWPDASALSRRQADAYGFRFESSRYRNRHGQHLTLLEYARHRGKWPDNKNRWCTSDFKRGPGARVLTRLRREAPGHILNIYGFRAEESISRSKRPVLARNKRISTKAHDVYDWLPIHTWEEGRVWHDIRTSGVEYHYAYDLGMPRLSCPFCIFAPESALRIAARQNPDLFQQYLQVEKEIGHAFKHNKPLSKLIPAPELTSNIPTDLLHLLS